MAKSLSTPHIPAKFKESITVKEADGVTSIEDLTMLKDHEVLMDDNKYPDNELITVNKTDKDHVNNSVQITRQIEQVINELTNEGILELGNNVFGVDIDLNIIESDPDNFIKYIGTIDIPKFKFTTTPITITDENEYSWNNPKFLYKLLGLRPVLLDLDGNVVKVFKNYDFSKVYDPSDTTFSNPQPYDYDSSTYDGLNIMIEFKKLYFKQWRSNNVIHFRFSPDKLSEKEGWLVHPAFLSERTQGKTESDYIYISAFHATRIIKDSVKAEYTLTSKQLNGTKENFTNIMKYTKEMGSGWEPLTLSKLSLLVELFIIMTQSTAFYDNYIMFRGDSSTVNQRTYGYDDYPNISAMNSTLYNSRVFGIDNLFGTPELFLGKNTLPSLDNNNSSKARILLAATGPYIENIGDEFGTNYLDSDVETYIDSGDMRYRTIISDLKFVGKQNFGERMCNLLIYQPKL